jgi:hypothetical protein
MKWEGQVVMGVRNFSPRIYTVTGLQKCTNHRLNACIMNSEQTHHWYAVYSVTVNAVSVVSIYMIACMIPNKFVIAVNMPQRIGSGNSVRSSLQSMHCTDGNSYRIHTLHTFTNSPTLNLNSYTKQAVSLHIFNVCHHVTSS